MPVNEQRFKIGLILILLGLGADLIASQYYPNLKACATVTCNVAETVGSASLLILILGILVQAFSLTRAAAPGSPAGPTAGPVLPGFPPAPPAGLPPPNPPAPVPSRPPFGAPPASSAPVRCPRCQAAYPVGQFAYCPACGSPLPFTSS